MAKLKVPLLSLDARNTIAKAITFVKRRGQNIVEKIPVVPDQKTAAQLSWRHMYQKCAALWHTLSADEKQEWESLARPKHMTGFAYWQSQCLKPNPGIYLPLQGGTMQGDIDMAGWKIEDLPDPSLEQDAATKAYVDLVVAGIHWDYAFSDTPSGIGAYFKMFTEPTGEPESTFTSGALGAGNDQALFQWISDAVVPFATIEAGVISFHIHAQRTVGNRSVNLYAKIYEYTSLAAELLIGTTEISAAVTDDKTSLVVHTSLSVDYDIALTSKLLVKLYANVGAIGANATVALYAEGTTSSRISVPVPTGALEDIFLRISAHTALGDDAPHHARYADAEAQAVADTQIAIHAALPNVHHTPAAPTKEFFAPVSVYYQNTVADQRSNHPGVGIYAGSDTAYVEFYVPADFTAITAAVAVFIPASNHTGRLSFYSGYGANGQSCVTHSGSDTNNDIVFTANQIHEFNISGILAALAAGDYVGIKILGESTNAPNVLALGVRFKYS